MTLLEKRQSRKISDNPPVWQRFKSFRVARAFDKCALDELLDRDWIRRAWTYQEIILASNPVVVCGEKSISWSRLHRGLSYLNDPVTPFHVNFMDLVRASFTYAGPKKTVPLRRSGKVYEEANALESFHTWKQMQQIWSAVYRPSCWNGRHVRKLPRGKDAESPTPLHSATSYQNELVQLAKTWHYARLMLALANIIIIPACVTVLVLIPLIWDAFNIQTNYDGPTPQAIQVYMSAGYVFGIVTCLPILFFIAGALITVYMVRMTPRPGLVDAANGKSIVGIVQALRERHASVPADKAFALHSVLDRLKLPTSKNGYTKQYGQVCEYIPYPSPLPPTSTRPTGT